MKRVDISYRSTKVGKHLVSVALCGFAVLGVFHNSSATEYNLTSSSTITRTTNSNSIDVIYNTSGNDTSNYNGNISIILRPGVDLSGEAPTGGTVVSIFTRDTADSTTVDTINFSNLNVTSTLNVEGNNDITGIVGYHINENDTEETDFLDEINIDGTGVIFNSKVNADVIDLNQGGTVEFFGDIDGSGGSSLNYNGHNASVTLHDNVTLTGNITNSSVNGSFILTGSAEVTGSVGSSTTSVGLTEIKGNSSTVRMGGTLATDKLDYQAASATVSVGGNLDLNNDSTNQAVNQVNFNGFNSTLQVEGNIVGVADQVAVVTTANNTGTVTMISGTQLITGDIGTTDESINQLNIGGTGSDGPYDNDDNVSSQTTVDGDVFATTIQLNNNDGNSTGDSTLSMAADHDITGDVTTEQNGRGNLTLVGGTQTVTGTVGSNSLRLDTVTSGANEATSTFTGTVYADNVDNSGTGTSNFEDNVTATNVDVLAGTSNFEKNLTATTTTISTGTGNFNTVDTTSTTNSAIVFSGAGTANLNQGLTGTIDFAANNATVNLFDGKTISGNISGSAGVLNALGAGTLSGTVNAVSELNINRDSADASGDTAEVTLKTVNAAQSVISTSVKLFNDGELVLADNADLTSSAGLTTTTDNTGVLTALGTSTIDGNVGVAGTALRTINSGADNEIVTFRDGEIYASTLDYFDENSSGDGSIGDGEVRFLGLSSRTDAVVENGVLVSGGSDLGFVGTVDFGENVSATGDGTFTLGDEVDLITEHLETAVSNTQTTFVNANTATLKF